jgi:SAM-dependent methyltransferase
MRPTFVIENFVHFFDYVRITGVFDVPGRPIKSLKVVQSGSVLATASVNLSSPGMGQNSRFAVSFLTANLTAEFDPNEMRLVFETEDGETFFITGSEVAHLHQRGESNRDRCEKHFFEKVKTDGFERVLEIGSRVRSEVCRRGLFEGKQYTGLDILEGPNVDVLGDAHLLSEKFPADSFDAIYSVSTFEHLAMPWKVALEVNKVLRPGGMAYFVTHQALGMHELPWDFWRFSDTSWNSLFNSYTGFRVLDTFLGDLMYIVPFVYRDHWKGYENAAGFAISSVLVEKTGPSTMEWNLDVAEVTKGIYPA